MEKVKVKVINAIKGKFDVDSITVKLNNIETEICFDKAEDVTKYNGKEILLSETDGIYTISPVEATANKESK